MNKKQWDTLSMAFWILTFIFIIMNLMLGSSCLGYLSFDPVTKLDIVACAKSEIYSPFIYLFFALAIAFSICARLEAKKK